MRERERERERASRHEKVADEERRVIASYYTASAAASTAAVFVINVHMKIPLSAFLLFLVSLHLHRSHKQAEKERVQSSDL